MTETNPIQKGGDVNISSNESVKTLAQRSYTYSMAGEIIDVQFSQAGRVNKLKTVIPGGYSIRMTQYTQEEIDQMPALQRGRLDMFDDKTNTIFFNDARNDSLTNLRILHEAGHAKDELIHTDQYQQIIGNMNSAVMKATIVFARRLQLEEEGNINFSQIRHDIESRFSEMDTPDKVAQLMEEYDLYLPELMKQSSSTELEKLENTYRRTVDKLIVKYKSQSERAAWAIALEALRKFQKQGIQLYEGTRKELFAFVDQALGSYYRVHQAFVTPDAPILKRKASIALVEQDIAWDIAERKAIMDWLDTKRKEQEEAEKEKPSDNTSSK